MIPYAFYTVAIVGFIVVPAACYALCRWLLPHRWGHRVGLAGALLLLLTMAYGWFWGSRQLVVRHETLAFSDLPDAFDGYRIVHFSDAHVGTLTGCRQAFLAQVVNTILAQQADMIVFTGDLQNIEPSELPQHRRQLSRLHAPDGVYAVLGNHDYDVYQHGSKAEKRANCLQTQQFERSVGWQLLMNEHRVVHRRGDSLVVAGMENWGDCERMPHRGDARKALSGLGRSPFVVMLEHDPTAWRKKILPACGAQLTLSGHTHGGQLRIGAWSPVAMRYREWAGCYREDQRTLLVSTGVGGLVPFRLNDPGEIIVITLKKKQQ